MGKEYPPSLADYPGERRKLPQRGPGQSRRAPAANALLAYLRSQNISSRENSVNLLNDVAYKAQKATCSYERVRFCR